MVDLKTVDGDHTQIKSAKYDTASGVLTLGRTDELKLGDGGRKFSATNEVGTDGSGETSASLEGPVDAVDGLSSMFGLG